MSLDVLVAVPAAPLVLRAVVPEPPDHLAPAVARLRADVDDALGILERVDVVVLLAGGDERLVHDAGGATLASYGLPDIEVATCVDTDLLGEVVDRGQASRVQDAWLHGDLAVLALQVAAAAPGRPLLPVTVPAAASAAALHELAAGLVAALHVGDRRVGVVAAGDLAATLTRSSPGALVDGASGWDRAAVRALERRDADALAGLGPQAAARVVARGWAPLVVLLALADAFAHELGAVRYHAPRGVGQLVVG